MFTSSQNVNYTITKRYVCKVGYTVHPTLSAFIQYYILICMSTQTYTDIATSGRYTNRRYNVYCEKQYNTNKTDLNLNDFRSKTTKTKSHESVWSFIMTKIVLI